MAEQFLLYKSEDKDEVFPKLLFFLMWHGLFLVSGISDVDIV